MRHIWLGRQPYTAVLRLQERIVEARKAQKHREASRADPVADPMALPDVMLLVEHPPVYTVGRRVPFAPDEAVRLRALGAEYVTTQRGGFATFHGPGQLVGYPIVDVMRLLPGSAAMQRYMHALEAVLIATCAHYGIAANTTADTGVWVGNDKIAALGVQVSFGIAWHGFALNCTTDLSWFDRIVPCGLAGKGVTSLTRQVDNAYASSVTVEHVHPVVTREFGRHFGRSMVPLEPAHTRVIHDLLALHGGTIASLPPPPPTTTATTTATTTSATATTVLP